MPDHALIVDRPCDDWWRGCPICHYGICGCGDVLDADGDLAGMLCDVCASIQREGSPVTTDIIAGVWRRDGLGGRVQDFDQEAEALALARMAEPR